MAKINLLPWRDELREQRKKQFVAFCVGVAALGDCICLSLDGCILIIS